MKKLYHLFLKQTSEHHYYGDLKVLTKFHSPEQLGVSIHTLYRTDFDEPYENENIILRKGKLVTSVHIRVDVQNSKID